jgi:hypothetical protein
MNIDAINHFARSRAVPATAEKIDRVTASGEATEYLMEMELCATGLWVFTVLPVQYENPH